MKRVLYLDLVGGVAGDMLLAALLDAGADLAVVRDGVKEVAPDVAVTTSVRYPAGIRAVTAEVHDAEHVSVHVHGHRPYKAIRERLEKAMLPSAAQGIALGAFRRLAEAEGAVHGVPPDEVEFHEVGSDDAIADVVGVAVAVASLVFDEVVASPVPIGRGLTRGAHGPIPLPGPATLELLRGAPLVETQLAGETVTPTGAALLMSIAHRFGPIPSMTLERIGVGAGMRDWPDRPNVVRAIVGHAAAQGGLEHTGELVVETNLDDMTPEHVAVLLDALLLAGALDAWVTPIHMKKGRPAVMVSALVSKTALEAVTRTFFTHSTTLGVRTHAVERTRTERHVEEVETEHGRVRVKVGARPEGPDLVMPEHDDCVRLAREKGTSVRAVSEAAQRAYWRVRGSPAG